ncbi:major paralogous domain-containing protein, partial [Fibrobacter sp. UWH9]|uniref:FISUMP domain-containing protein n=1 Tax=Fibrobacter sp. UWH9 TaxID=1896213 RepID=UPI0009239C41
GGESNPASSSVKSSSSGTSADSSAGNSSSSSESALEPCDAEEEGETKRVLATGVRYICKNGFWVEVESSSSVSSSSYFDMTNQFNEKVSYGEFTDPRDGQKYRTVSLKDGIYYTDTLVYFAENLNFGKMIAGGTLQGDSTKYCYDDDPWYCENGWGGLYTWSNAMNLPSVCDSVSLGSEQCNYSFARDKDGKLIDGEIIHQGLCPDGWHIANEGEWANLQEKSGNSVAHYMGSKVAGFGNNDYGLSILPTGSWERYPNGSLVFRDIKKQAIFWTPQQSADDAERAHRVAIDSQDMSRIYEEVKAKRALSIRCVKNY